MMDKIFYKWVDVLEWLANKLYILYEQINVIVFVLIWPLVTIYLLLK